MATRKKSKGVKKVSTKCFKCERRFDASDLTMVKPDEYFCAPCHERTFFRCEHCHKVKLRGTSPGVDGDLAPAQGKTLCEYCFYSHYRECRGCSGTFVEANGVTTQSGNFFCTPCSANRFFDCSYCSRRQETDRLWRRIEGEGSICQGCQGNYEAEMNPPPIANYSFKPRPRFRGKDRAGLFFGFELEVERKQRLMDADTPRRLGLESVAKRLRERIVDENGKPFLYMKYDGSLQDGFEIVSHPFSWSWLLQNRDRFDPIFDLPKNGFLSHDSGRCGMHVHLSKAGFSPLHLYKFIQFFQREKDFILRISQRGVKMDSLGHYARLEYSEGDSKKYIQKLAKAKGGHSGRYQAINLQPTQTAEIRIFRGTLKRERFFKNLEFCRAAYEFTLINSEANCKLEYFIGFVHRYRNEFPHLYSFLEERYKFSILKKNSGKKGVPREAIRFSGPKSMGTNTDVADEVWESSVAETRKKKEEKIEAMVLEAKKKKEVSLMRAAARG